MQPLISYRVESPEWGGGRRSQTDSLHRRRAGKTKARDVRASYQQLPFFACPGGQNPFPGPPCGATTTGGPGT
ncbi:hypothetical protein EMIT0111MI5_80264 [Burkholderia sp. IT-111MI5]